ncbi:AP-3 complex subunit delta-1 [Eurytemora carolleeae]|uniref:AP-3 complex subunit delta-1 n=1 Tax=Eurytemora carolleeae TaxID=1294199 RepID=UPI000C7715A0|nr:AP-3 complex subunit delta-1 [Eurytemora carolleeae]XP_023340048.1 AP-3 complex subunit delta-1 [Eurytemora carolleeae]XP_023340147.1 AP-3 complex subunit delta-1 [Eurytemora carolleeae]XP_023340218.1 AP-3 complex subunit delta-1 [Eurytemora carolleeae]|eukprot:XP_023339973.1 AP-3 complex subunit delta-1-like [Eurytemora affinis]
MALQKVKGNLERMFDKNLTDLVRGIRNNRESEGKYIAQCLEEIKLELRQYNPSVKANAVAKLTYLQMLGYDISWAGFNIIEVMSSTKFTEKRIGYLAASQSFHQDTEVLMLATNMIRKDLSSTSQYEAGLTLSSLSCFLSPDLARDLANDIMSLLTSTKPYLRKKGVLLLYKVFLRYPEALRPAFPRLKEKLEDPDPGVQSAAVNVICELARKNPKNYLSLAPTFFKLMTSSTNNWMLIKIIKLFGALTPLEPRLGKKLIEPLTNLIHSTSAMSLLYECINTVIAVLISISTGMPNHAASIQLCVQKLRILIEDSDQNLKYLGLLAMSKILKTSPKSVSSHKDLVMTCLDDADDSIRLRALDLLSGMVSKKNLMEIVKKLMSHMSKAEGTTYRDELLTKILEICNQNDYQYISNFEWYVSVLVELSQMEGGTHGGKLAHQMMDVSIRVESIRPFAVEQMSLLIENSSVLLRSGRHTSAAEVLYAACWLVGEFSTLLSNPRQALISMIQGLDPHLAPHIQATYVHNILKLYTRLEETDTEIDSMILVKLEDLVSSPNLEVQERASTALQVVKSISNPDLGQDNLRQDFQVLYAGELNPVGPKAQKKVPVPEGLDLDAWINPPPEESESEDENNEEMNGGLGQVFVKDEQADKSKQYKPEPTSQELEASRVARLAVQSSNPNYLKAPTRSPMHEVECDGREEIPVQAIDLDVPLHIPGLASVDSYLNLESKTDKKKKKKKKSKKAVSSSEDDEPNIAVSKHLEMPEGASVSDLDDDQFDPLDPHSALAQISLEDLEPTRDKSKKDKKKGYSDLVEIQNNGGFELLNSSGETPLVEHKTFKKKHKTEKKKSKKKEKEQEREQDLLGLDEDEKEQEIEQPGTGLVKLSQVLCSDENLQVSYSPSECKVTNGACSVPLTITNLGDDKCKELNLTLNDEYSLTKSLKPGEEKTKTVVVPVEGEMILSIPAILDYRLKKERKLEFSLTLPATAWLTGAASDTEQMAELLMSGQLAFMLSASIHGEYSIKSVLPRLVGLGLYQVDVQQGTTASMYGISCTGTQLAFLVKLNPGILVVEGRSSNKELLAAILEQISAALV